jgi:hypothetical protein
MTRRHRRRRRCRGGDRSGCAWHEGGQPHAAVAEARQGAAESAGGPRIGSRPGPTRRPGMEASVGGAAPFERPLWTRQANRPRRLPPSAGHSKPSRRWSAAAISSAPDMGPANSIPPQGRGAPSRARPPRWAHRREHRPEAIAVASRVRSGPWRQVRTSGQSVAGGAACSAGVLATSL